MEAFSVIMSILMYLGFALVVFLFLREPFVILKSILNGMKANWRLRYITFPIWLPIWIIDKSLNLNIFEE